MNPELFAQMPDMPEDDLFPDVPDFDDLEEEYEDEYAYEDEDGLQNFRCSTELEIVIYESERDTRNSRNGKSKDIYRGGPHRQEAIRRPLDTGHRYTK